MTNQPRKTPTMVYSTDFLDGCSKEFIEKYILRELGDGQVLTFGCKRSIDRALQRLRNADKIKYIKVKDGGHGWQLV